MRTSRCKQCNAPIIWARNDAGKWAPVDADPTDQGTHVLMGWDDPPTAVACGAGELAFDELRDRYTLHFVTCPSTRAYRRRSDGQRSKWRL